MDKGTPELRLCISKFYKKLGISKIPINSFLHTHASTRTQTYTHINETDLGSPQKPTECDKHDKHSIMKQLSHLYDE